jgi:Uma2 family endonuclease
MSAVQELEKPEILTETFSNNPEDVTIPHGEKYSNEPELESSLHLQQIIVLLTSLEWLWSDRQDYFVAGNLTIYYSSHQRKSEEFRGPDLFVVLDTERKPRKSWVVWEEDGKYPHLIIEILSESTASVDRGLKKQIYQETFRTPNYFLFDPETLELTGYHLVNGKYQLIEKNQNGLLWSEPLGLYLGVYKNQLRWFNVQGELGETSQETAIKVQENYLQAEREKLQLAQEKLQLEQEKLETEQKLQETANLLAIYQERFGKLREND